jgi:hypothetical protein
MASRTSKLFTKLYPRLKNLDPFPRNPKITKMTSFLLALSLASHNPYHWEMSCARWHEITLEIMMDNKLDYNSKRNLIRKFRTKVRGECDGTFI